MTTHEFTPFARTVHALLSHRLGHYTIDLIAPTGAAGRGAQAWVIDGPSVVTVAINLDGFNSWNQALGFAQTIAGALDWHGLEHSVVSLAIDVFGEKAGV